MLQHSATRSALAFAAGVAVAGYALPALRRLWLRRRDRAAAPATINSAEVWAALGASRSGTQPGEVGLFAFYSGVTGAITTVPELMSLPIDDHAIVRGHAVFDTCTLAAGRMYRLRIHLQRFLQSARAARIPLPYGDDDATNLRQLTALIGCTCAASGKRDADVRFWLSAGTGNLGVTPAGCTTRLYVLVFGGLPSLAPSDGTDGFAEVTTPHKPTLLRPECSVHAALCIQAACSPVHPGCLQPCASRTHAALCIQAACSPVHPGCMQPCASSLPPCASSLQPCASRPQPCACR